MINLIADPYKSVFSKRRSSMYPNYKSSKRKKSTALYDTNSKKNILFSMDSQSVLEENIRTPVSKNRKMEKKDSNTPLLFKFSPFPK